MSLLLQAIANSDATPDPGSAHTGVYVLGAMSAAVCAGLASVRKQIDQPTLIYLLAPVPLFALFTWLAVTTLDPDGTSVLALDFLALQVLSLLLGAAHVWVFYKEVSGRRALTWPVGSRDRSWQHFGFTFVLMVTGCIGVMLASVLPFTGVEQGWKFFPALLTFLVPFIWLKALDLYTGIPAAVYEPWYPSLHHYIYITDPRFPKILIKLHFEPDDAGELPDVACDPNKPLKAVFNALLPLSLRDHPDTYYQEREDGPYVWGWHFHRERTSWIRWNRRIDPAHTFLQAGLRDGDTIIALRDPAVRHIDKVNATEAGINGPDKERT